MFAPGRLLEVGAVTFSTGGPVSNTGLALNKLGIKTQLMGKIGADLFGSAVKQLVSNYDPHLAEGMVVDPAVDTSYTLVINPPQVDRIFLHHAGANDTFMADDVRYGAVAEVRHFHFGYPPIMRSMYDNEGVELAEIFRRAKTTGVTTSLDMSLPDPTSASGQADWRTILRATLPHVDLFLPSAEEILYMLHRPTFDELHRAANGQDVLPLFTPHLLTDISRDLINLGVKIVCIKLGHRGFYLHTASLEKLNQLGRARLSKPEQWANKQIWAPAFQVEEIGATGAGDASIAGFLSAFLRDLSPEAAITAATAVGACNVEAADGISGIRPWPETVERIAAGWPRRKLQLEAPSWEFDTKQQLWFGPA
jgi:sugar/nucleoside kinase (ribokinase family)